MKSRITKSLLGGAAVAAAVVMLNPAAASAAPTTGTAAFTGGTLSYTAPGTIAFPTTLTGAAQNVPANQLFAVNDATGTGAGWNITATSTTWTLGANVLANTASTDTAATGACDATATGCGLGTNGVAYPLTIPAGATAPTAIKIQAAALTTGSGLQNWTHVMNLAVPPTAKVGTYLSTWTYSLVSAP